MFSALFLKRGGAGRGSRDPQEAAGPVPRPHRHFRSTAEGRRFGPSGRSVAERVSGCRARPSRSPAWGTPPGGDEARRAGGDRAGWLPSS